MPPEDLRVAVIDQTNLNGLISKDYWPLINGNIRYIYLSDEVE